MSQGIAPARRAAFEILLKMEGGTGHSDELLRAPLVASLSAQDRNLCTNLVMGTLRWQIALDAQVRRLLTRPDVQLAPGVRVALRLGAFQLLHLDRIPAHAAISESVEIAKFGGEGFAAGMVNAVLRKIATAGLPTMPQRFRTAAELAAAYAHPAWMVERWAHAYGMAAAEQICRYNQEPPPISIRLGNARADGSEIGLESAPDFTSGSERQGNLLKELEEGGIELAPGAFLTQSHRVLHGDVTTTEAYRSGRLRIQDEGSQLVAELAGKGHRILDCCAAPGGKTAILAERNPTSHVLACDVSARRLEQMKRMAGPSKPLADGSSQVTYQVMDAADLRRDGEFDLVLCDVPCSGTGTLAHNPEIRHRMGQESLARHEHRQIEILRSAMRAAAPGGRVVYATCSLEPEENERVVAACLEAAPEYRCVPFDAVSLSRYGVRGEDVPAAFDETTADSIFKHGFLRTIPGLHSCDGFFAALLVKI